MPDRQKEAITTYLPGQVTETPSSDSSIERRVAGMGAEVYGENGQIIDIDQSDISPPKSTVGLTAESSGQQVESPRERISVPHQLRSFDIRFQLLAARRWLVDKSKVKELARNLKQAA